jgi:CRISPR/Cas system-associated exonuclease Cas4 (RecB family)
MQSSLRARRESQASGPETAVVSGQGPGKPRWLSGLIELFGSRPSGRRAAGPGVNALLAFPSEEAPRTEPVPTAEVATQPASREPLAPRLVRSMLVAVAIVVPASLAVLAIRFPLQPLTAGEPRAGNLTIDTRPVAAEVLVDGQPRGMSPLTLSLNPGAHTIIVRNGSDERVVPLTIAAGADVTQHFEMKASEPAALFGRLSVATDPPGSRVAVDGRPRGTSPVTVADLTAEEHTVTVTNDAGSAERKVMVTADGTASVMFSLSKVSGPVGGWLSISAPFNVEVVENGDLVGTSGTSRIMVAAGRHDVVLTNRSLGYQEARRIDVTAGKTTVVRVEPPQASVSVNARPWAEILLDGTSVGQTPIANLLVTVGPHELVFRHPQLAERKQTVLVTSNGPNRIAADLTK